MVLHVYGQGSWHDPVVIVGDADGLRALHRALDLRMVEEASTIDGEGYDILVREVEPADCRHLPLPYTSAIANEIEPEKWEALRKLVQEAT